MAEDGDSDRDDIVALMARYARALDTRDESAFRACLADEVRIDNAGNPTLELSGDDWAAQAMRAVGFFDGTEHRISNPQVSVSGDDAQYTADLEARHWNPDTTIVVFASYARGGPSLRPIAPQNELAHARSLGGGARKHRLNFLSA
jgi:hypothetical protein